MRGSKDAACHSLRRLALLLHSLLFILPSFLPSCGQQTPESPRDACHGGGRGFGRQDRVLLRARRWSTPRHRSVCPHRAVYEQKGVANTAKYWSVGRKEKPRDRLREPTPRAWLSSRRLAFVKRKRKVSPTIVFRSQERIIWKLLKTESRQLPLHQIQQLPTCERKDRRKLLREASAQSPSKRQSCGPGGVTSPPGTRRPQDVPPPSSPRLAPSAPLRNPQVQTGGAAHSAFERLRVPSCRSLAFIPKPLATV